MNVIKFNLSLEFIVKSGLLTIVGFILCLGWWFMAKEKSVLTQIEKLTIQLHLPVVQTPGSIASLSLFHYLSSGPMVVVKMSIREQVFFAYVAVPSDKLSSFESWLNGDLPGLEPFNVVLKNLGSDEDYFFFEMSTPSHD